MIGVIATAGRGPANVDEMKRLAGMLAVAFATAAQSQTPATSEPSVAVSSADVIQAPGKAC